ncbi:cell wall metabolism sensor histidine kinase WalK [Austwickia sp. TVS 96-490-7B]|uniref:sensor histidine kinase n=1 Tax=Austwickia sp. TVS 96-490-7B TaxID=2830843 RepID=UPI002103C306|nr:HAMP domain-containing sensor histidine kinase [Austwickia sp. TVS 96-490-7B]
MSLRRKLVASIVALFILVTITTGVVSLLVTRHALSVQLDRRVAQTVTRAGDPGTAPAPPRPTAGERGLGRGIGGDFLYLAYRDDKILRFTAFTTSGDLVDATNSNNQVIHTLRTAPLSERPSTVDLGPELGSYRLVRAERPHGATVITGLPLQPMVDTLDNIILVTALVGGAGILVLAGGTAALVQINLRPLDRVAALADRVSRTPLHQGEVDLPDRVPARDTDRRTEVGQVGAALNELLDHVGASLHARYESETKLRRFVADASHELRTPLASIRGYAELSRRESEPVPEGIRHALSRIDSESARMAHLVEDLLLLARLDAGRPLASDTVDVTRLVIDTVSDARAAGPDHRWQMCLPEDVVEITGDGSRLTQVVVNLLANARVHTPTGTTVTTTVRTEADHAVITVVDDGPGIPADLLPRVFTRFTRGDESRARLTETPEERTGASTGLGLSIVAAVVAAHHGDVHVHSTPGNTVFTVRLPHAVTAPSEAPD